VLAPRHSLPHVNSQILFPAERQGYPVEFFFAKTFSDFPQIFNLFALFLVGSYVLLRLGYPSRIFSDKVLGERFSRFCP